ncbi:hypothetical protein P7K49_029717 [Saguinus oedipus]|uniref:Uncharacterized protein n=1 Tax=Saguinus oedipus TaxID=9490 RepID=A0ABQ9U979_SAGOE|nr:hypothetical protein P7K49_029717 [Saguinus oedipus]
MDFEFAAWQMLYLFTSPQRVYRNFHYRKQTKDQWARDDPAFLVLLSIWLCGKSRDHDEPLTGVVNMELGGENHGALECSRKAHLCSRDETHSEARSLESAHLG